MIEIDRTQSASNKDREHLDLLGVFHYVVAGLAAFCSLIPVLHLVIGVALLASGDGPPIVPFIFIGVASTIILLGLTFSFCLAFAGQCLRRRQRYTFCFVMAAISCLFQPFGLILGIFTIIKLSSDPVKEMFRAAETVRR